MPKFSRNIIEMEKRERMRKAEVKRDVIFLLKMATTELSILYVL